MFWSTGRIDVQTDKEGDVVMRDGSSLARDVLAIPELLEAILAALPIRDLLLAQRVATNWRDAVQRSKVLRRLLFLEPTKDGEIVAVMKPMCSDCNDTVSRRAVEDNVYFESTPPCARFDTFLPVSHLDNEQYYCRVVALNPLLCTARILHARCKTLPVDPVIILQPKVENGHEYKQILPALYGEDRINTASCTQMFLTQPPVSNLDFRLWDAAKQCLPFNQYFSNHPSCRGDRVTRTKCCGVICCRDCVRRLRSLDRSRARVLCPICGDKFRSEDGMTTEPFKHNGNGIRLMDLLDAVAKEWGREEDGERVYGDDVREATMGLYFKKTDKKAKFCVGTLVLHPDESAYAQSQIADA